MVCHLRLRRISPPMLPRRLKSGGDLVDRAERQPTAAAAARIV